MELLTELMLSSQAPDCWDCRLLSQFPTDSCPYCTVFFPPSSFFLLWMLQVCERLLVCRCPFLFPCPLLSPFLFHFFFFLFCCARNRAQIPLSCHASACHVSLLLLTLPHCYCCGRIWPWVESSSVSVSWVLDYRFAHHTQMPTNFSNLMIYPAFWLNIFNFDGSSIGDWTQNLTHRKHELNTQAISCH